MKKTVIFLLTLSLSLSLTGCGAAEEAQEALVETATDLIQEQMENLITQAAGYEVDPSVLQELMEDEDLMALLEEAITTGSQLSDEGLTLIEAMAANDVAQEGATSSDQDDPFIPDEPSYLMWDGIFVNTEYGAQITTQDLGTEVQVTVVDPRLVAATGSSENSYTLTKNGYDGNTESASYLQEFDGTGDISVIDVQLSFSGGEMMDGNNLCVSIAYYMTNGDFILADCWGIRYW